MYRVKKSEKSLQSQKTDWESNSSKVRLCMKCYGPMMRGHSHGLWYVDLWNWPVVPCDVSWTRKELSVAVLHGILQFLFELKKFTSWDWPGLLRLFSDFSYCSKSCIEAFFAHKVGSNEAPTRRPRPSEAWSKPQGSVSVPLPIAHAPEEQNGESCAALRKSPTPGLWQHSWTMRSKVW